MKWSGYGVIVGVKNYNHQYQIITVLSEYGKWSGLHTRFRGFVGLFTQAICQWSGNSEDTIGYWCFSNLKQFYIPQLDQKHYKSLLTMQYICQLIQIYIPERIVCQDIFEAIILANQYLNEYKWLQAWIDIESIISGLVYAESDNLQLFFQQVYDNLKYQYQTEYPLPLRKILLTYL